MQNRWQYRLIITPAFPRLCHSPQTGICVVSLKVAKTVALIVASILALICAINFANVNRAAILAFIPLGDTTQLGTSIQIILTQVLSGLFYLCHIAQGRRGK